MERSEKEKKNSKLCGIHVKATIAVEDKNEDEDEAEAAKDVVGSVTKG